MTRAPIRRYEMNRPGELVHVDIKKLGRIPKGGGWRAHGRGRTPEHRKNMVGYAYVHTAIDGYSRLAYSEVLANEQAVTAAAFWRRAEVFFAEHGITVERVLSDNGSCYRSRCSPPLWLGPATASPGPTDPRPMAKRSASTAPSWPSGLTPEPGRQKANATARLLTGSTSTTIIDTTRHRGPPMRRVGNVTGHYN